MDIALWITAALLALAALGGGVMMLIQPREKLAAAGWAWVEDFGTGFVRMLGGIKLLAAAGLILPAALGIAPVLVPVAATGWVLLMVGAVITHLRRHESQPIVVNLTLLAMAAFIAVGRFAI